MLRVYCLYRERRPMSDEFNSKTDSNTPMVYQIRLKGQLGHEWADSFGSLSITLEEDGDTLITGPVVDQAMLHGLLKKVRDLGLPLVSVNPVEPGQPDVSESTLDAAQHRAQRMDGNREKRRRENERAEHDG
jgi:hypothetical protein